MTRKLESLFDLPPADAVDEPTTAKEAVDLATTQVSIAESMLTLTAADDAIDKIDAALPTVRDLAASDQEMDELATLAKDNFENLMDLAMNVEPRFSGPIIQSASALLGHAITAKMAKMDKKLKMVDLQLKKARLDQTASQQTPGANAVDGKGMVIDRNELLRSILSNTTKTNK